MLRFLLKIGCRIIAPSPNISITYCRLCGWLLRAGWTGQELLSTFAEELGSVTLIPDATGGVFEVRIDDKLIWSRGQEGRFPEMKELKQLVRDTVAPSRDLGHVDAKDSKT
jgi:selenoprotein W-related protein